MNRLKGFRFGGPRLAFGLSVTFLIVLTGFTYQTHAALSEAGQGADLIIGSDDDRQDNVAIQAGAGANQSLNRTDVLEGGKGNDVIFGLNGNDVIDGGPDQDRMRLSSAGRISKPRGFRSCSLAYRGSRKASRRQT